MTKRKTASGMSRADFDKFHDDREYPTNLAAAVDELRQRGYDAHPNTLNYLIRKGVVDDAPEGPRSQPSWTKKRIDQAARWMEENQLYSPLGQFHFFMGIDPAQYYEAKMKVIDEQRAPVDRMAMVIFPGFPRRVAFVPPTAIKEK
jgi:hypothetical protein